MAHSSTTKVSKVVRAFQDKIKQLIGEIGEKQVLDILINEFGVNTKEGRKFLDLLSDLHYIGFSYNALPEPEFFLVKRMKIKRRGKGPRIEETPRNQSGKIKIEHPILVSKVRNYRKLPENQKEIAIEYWPEEYRDALNKATKEVSPANVANMILAKRWTVSEATIAEYVKNRGKSKK